jgi:hypothetical protein
MGWNYWNGPTSRVCYFEAGNNSQGGAAGSALNAITYDVWQHYGCVFDQINRQVIFFINGVPVNISGITTVADIGMNNANFQIGAFLGPSYYMNAQVGYVKIYNYLFNATDMFNEYQTNKARFGL